MMTLWTGLKQLHSTFDDTIGQNEEEDQPDFRPFWSIPISEKI